MGLLLLACTGCYQGVSGADLDGGDSTGAGETESGESEGESEDVPASCEAGPMVASRPLRRLTPTQYENTMRDLLGDPGFVADYDATEAVITERGVRQLRDGAELALARRAQWTAPVFPCDIEGSSDDACADALIDQFAPRAFRRPLLDEERAWLQGVYLDARADLGFTDAMEVLAGTMLQEAMRIELEAFMADVMQDDASFERLMTSNRAYVNGPLAALYGVTGGPLGEDEWAWVELPASERAGVLTRAAFLSVFSSTSVQSPIRRGTFTLEEVMCFSLGDPPADVDNTPIDGASGEGEVLTVREATEARTGGNECRGCHSVINPVGFAFEHYDAIGRWQDQGRIDIERPTAGLLSRGRGSDRVRLRPRS